MRPTAKIVLLLSLIFVLHTGYYPIQHGANGFKTISAADLIQNNLDSSESLVLRNIKYGTESLQNFDLYLPAGRSEETTKVLVMLHGGSWVRGDKAGINGLVSILLERFPEHAIVNMNYSLAGKDNFAFPNQFEDIQKVLDNITLNTSKYQLQPVFGIIGKSAGGHLGLLFDNVYDKYDQVKFVCSIAGPTNLTDPLYVQKADFKQLHTMLIDTRVFQDNALEALSPLHNVHPLTSPSLLLYGKTDQRVPVSNGLDYSRTLKAANVPHELHLFEGGHMKNWSQDNWALTYDRIEVFVKKYLN